MRIEVHAAGALHLPSGRLTAADPGWMPHGGDPYTATVSPGTYPVTISLASFDDDPNHTRVAAARLDITDKKISSWEMALRDGQHLLALGNNEFFGLGIDSATACFADADHSTRPNEYWRQIGPLVEPRYVVIDTGAVVAWSTGWGDGSYPTWIGRDTDGEIVCYLADMLLFSDDDQDTAEHQLRAAPGHRMVATSQSSSGQSPACSGGCAAIATSRQKRSRLAVCRGVHPAA